MGRSRKPPPEWNDIVLARHLNAALGTSTITPWGLGQIPEHWIELIIKATRLEAQLIEQGLVK